VRDLVAQKLAGADDQVQSVRILTL
jgi:hypothetical protein